MYNASGLTRNVAQTSQGLSWIDPVNAQTSTSVLDTAPPETGGPSIVAYNSVEIRKRPAHTPADSISYQTITKSHPSIPLANAYELLDPSLASATKAPTVRAFRLNTRLPDPSDWTVSSPWSNDKKPLWDYTVTRLATTWASLDEESLLQFDKAYESIQTNYSVRNLAQLLSAAVLLTNPSYVKWWETRKDWTPRQKKVYHAERTTSIFFGEEEKENEEEEKGTADSPVHGIRYKDLPPDHRTNRAEVNDPVKLWMTCIAVDPLVDWFTLREGTVVSAAQARLLAAVGSQP